MTAGLEGLSEYRLYKTRMPYDEMHVDNKAYRMYTINSNMYIIHSKAYKMYTTNDHLYTTYIASQSVYKLYT